MGTGIRRSEAFGRRIGTAVVYCAALLFGLFQFDVYVATALAQGESSSDGQGSADPPKPSEAASGCSATLPADLPPGNLKVSVTLDPPTAWQTRGEEVRLVVKGTGFQ